MRGKDRQFAFGCGLRGITPAGAGKSFLFFRRFLRCRDHPRRCGEKGPFHNLATVGGGSPPQVRGKGQSSSPFRISLRITPAGAGKSFYCDSFKPVRQDHPRRCGEKFIAVFRYWRLGGSPPQVRGKVTSLSVLLLGTRITPAGAGKRLKKHRF